MKQPKLKITNAKNKIVGVIGVVLISWDIDGRISTVTVYFMGDNNSNDFLTFYNNNNKLVTNSYLYGELMI